MKQIMIRMQPKPQSVKTRRKGIFSRRVLLFGFGFIFLYTVWVMWEQHRTGMEPSPTLTQWVYSFWGVEVMMLCLKRIFAKPSNLENNGQQEG